jgi:hypothetical protein
MEPSSNPALGSAGEPAPDDVLLTPSEAARELRLSESHLATLRSRGGGPAFFKFGSSVRYSRRLIHEWKASRLRRNTAEAAA